jgi:chromosome condensin MukBEF complex kleisin-like MukF subunit
MHWRKQCFFPYKFTICDIFDIITLGGNNKVYYEFFIDKNGVGQ